MQINNCGRTDALKEYYGKYLREVRGLSVSSVKHYYDALNNISRRLRKKGLVQRNIYEVMDITTLEKMRDALYEDHEFIEQDSRGRRMYSSGLNNYIRFASGEEFTGLLEEAVKLDTPLAPEDPIIVERQVWRRSNILRKQALALANYTCEIDKAHGSFIAERTGKPYMEGHHAIPMRYQKLFSNSIDVYANIVCLCPECHRKIHYGLPYDRRDMICNIFDDREERLHVSGINLSRQEFIDIIMGND